MQTLQDAFNFQRAEQYLKLYFAYRKLQNVRGMVSTRRACEYYKGLFKYEETLKAFGDLENKLLEEEITGVKNGGL
jgi:hypothetical protein